MDAESCLCLDVNQVRISIHVPNAREVWWIVENRRVVDALEEGLDAI